MSLIIDLNRRCGINHQSTFNAGPSVRLSASDKTGYNISEIVTFFGERISAALNRNSIAFIDVKCAACAVIGECAIIYDDVSVYLCNIAVSCMANEFAAVDFNVKFVIRAIACYDIAVRAIPAVGAAFLRAFELAAVDCNLGIAFAVININDSVVISNLRVVMDIAAIYCELAVCHFDYIAVTAGAFSCVFCHIATALNCEL